MCYHLTDHQFSTVALIDSSATLLERVTYDAYGMARHHWAADVTGDGAVGTADRNAATAALNKSIGDAEYNVDADVTRTGTVTSTDGQWFNSSNFKAALPKGDLSAYGNVIGYCGYVFNPEVPTTGGGGGLYTVRFRHYDAELGRWLERDPLGYVDGMNLYGYGFNSPSHYNDPFGLSNTRKLRRLIQEAMGWGKWWPKDADGSYHVDHIVLKMDGGTDDVSNIRALSKKDHIQRHKDRGDFRRAGKRGAEAKKKGGGGKALGLIAIVGIFWAVDDATAAAPELLLLFQLLDNTADEHVAMDLIDQIVDTLNGLYGSQAIRLREKLKEKWNEKQRNRALERAKQSQEKKKKKDPSGPPAGPKDESTGGSSGGFDPCS